MLSVGEFCVPLEPDVSLIPAVSSMACFLFLIRSMVLLMSAIYFNIPFQVGLDSRKVGSGQNFNPLFPIEEQMRPISSFHSPLPIVRPDSICDPFRPFVSHFVSLPVLVDSVVSAVQVALVEAAASSPVVPAPSPGLGPPGSSPADADRHGP